MHKFFLTLLAAFLPGISNGVQVVEQHRSSSESKPIAVEDLVRYAMVGDPGTLSSDESSGEAGIYSPDGQLVAVVVHCGNPEQETNDATLLIYRITDLFHKAIPQVVARFASATNYQPIALVRWLHDSETLMFAGTAGHQRSQIYRVNVRTRKIDKLTEEPEQIVWYDVTFSGDRLVTLTKEPKQPPAENSECKDRGCLVTATTLRGAIDGTTGGSAFMAVYDLLRDERRTIANPEVMDKSIKRCDDALFGRISPDGRFVLRRCVLRNSSSLSAHAMDSEGRGVRRLVITDLQSGTSASIGDGASMDQPAPIWIDNGRYFIWAEIIERSAAGDVSHGAQTQRTIAVNQVDPRSLRSTPAVEWGPKVVGVANAYWDEKIQTLTVQTQVRMAERNDPALSLMPPVRYRRKGDNWEVTVVRASKRRVHADIRLVVKQSLGERPVLMAIDPRSGATRHLLDPNPWLASRALGRAEAIDWESAGGTWHGGLYYPPNYVAGKRYPLVIQTHGFAPDTFSLSGLSRNYAGRVLAAHDIIVLQLDESHRGIAGTPADWTTSKAGYEGAIDHLDRLGLIDRRRIGIQGCGRTGAWVGFTLTQSSYQFAASALTDTSDNGWWSYLSLGAPPEMDELFGTPPIGEGLRAWFKYSPTFNLDRVRTPMLMWSSEDPIALWDWYAGLNRLKKPVEYWVLPDGSYQPFQVGHRVFTNQLLVDWFRFWLKDEEDAAVEKKDQYIRWRQLRERRLTQWDYQSMEVSSGNGRATTVPRANSRR